MNLNSLMNLIGFTGKAHGTPPTPGCVSDDGMPDDPSPSQGSFRAGFSRYISLSASPKCSNLGRRLVLLLPLLALLAGMLSLSDAPPVSADHSSAGAEQTILSAMLTVKDLGGGNLGCTGSSSNSCALTSVLTDDEFRYLGVTYTVTKIQLNSSGTLEVTFDKAIPPRLKRKLTLQVGNRKVPLTDAAFTPNDTVASWTSTGLIWTANQQVPLSLTLGPHWTGVVLESASFIPSNERWIHDLLVAEGDSATFGIKLSKQPTANVTVALGKSYLGWQEHGDINAATVSPTNLTFTPSNYSTFQTVTVTGVPDADADHEHLSIRVQVASSDTDYGSVDGFEYVFVTVSDDGGAVQVGAWPAFGREAGNGQTRNVPVTVWLSRSSTAPVYVSYRTDNGTARAGQDYTAVKGTLAFPAGETRKTVSIPILDDNVEDSGETFEVELSNPQGATLAPGYDGARVTILNDEAHLDGLSAEGASGAGGPWVKLDLGAFAAETTDYAVTVTHGTTHARLTPETADEDMTVKAGAGADLTRVRSGEAGPAVALAVGDNVLVVKTTAGTGLHETYTVTLTREASQHPKPELSDFVKQYDANGNGLIDLLEYAQAGQDYGNKVITLEQFTEVKNAWFESEKYLDQIAELPDPAPEEPESEEPEPSRGVPPQNVKIVPGDGQLSVSWEVGSRDGVEDSDIYHAIRWRQNPGPGKWENTHPGHVLPKDGHFLFGGVTSFVIKGRQNDVAADVHIRAFTGGNYYDHAETSSEWLTFKGVETTPFKPNRAPTVANAIQDATIANESGTKRIALSSVFADDDGDSLTLTAKTSADGVATVSVAADYSKLTITAKARGTTTITAIASDGNGGSVEDNFTVTVKAAPAVASAITDIGSLIAGTSQEVALTSVFSDADNDALTPSASSSATAVATVAVATDGSSLTVAGVAEGTATITVTVQDSDGNSVSDTFDVTVVKVNKAPTVASAISDAAIVNTSGTKRVSLSGVFTDADGDSLTITAKPSAAAVATVSVAADYSSLTLTAKSRGTATITVTASDGKGGSVEDSFTVTVKAAPVVASAIADISELAAGASQQISLSDVFSDADGDNLIITASSSKDSVATVSVAADQSGLTLTGKTAGTATVTVTARDSDGNSVSDAFDVAVVKVNSAPTVANAFTDGTITNESGSSEVSLSGVFTDADSDSLTITATSSSPSVATVAVAADYSKLTITAKARGTTTITAIASDGNGGSVEDNFTVTVKAAPAVASAITDIGSLVAGTSQEVALTSVFSDADNDALTLSASSSATAVATVSVATDGSSLTVAGVAEGTATITVTARDSDGNSVSDTFDVTVVRVNKAPTVASAISDATIVNTSGTKRVSLSGVFTDADGDSLTITAKTSAAAVAAVSVAADYSTLTVTAKSRGTATVTVTASDGKGDSVEDSFTVTVKAAPVVASAIADISELAAGASQQISLAGVFSDADGDALTLSAVSSSNAVVTVLAQIDPSTGSATAITVTGVDEGTATVTVTARDTDGNSVSDAFDVTVPVEEQQQAVELPGPVVSLAVTASAEDSVTVSWSAPETGGAPQGYIVHIKRKGGGYQDTRRPGAEKTQVSFGSLDPGRTYDVWVRAQNETGKGERVSASITLPQSEEPEDTPVAVLPGPVTGLDVTADGNALTVSWSAPATGGAPDGYIVHVSPEDGGKGKTKTPKAKKAQVTFENLEAGATYAVWVRAQNEAGKGERVHASITLPEDEDVHTGQ